MNTACSLVELSSLFHKELKDHYPKEEIDAFFFLSMSDLLGITRQDIRAGKYESLKTQQADLLYSVLNELKTHKPIQYILGFTEFYGCKIRVNESVLIPRPETEELIELILSDAKQKTSSQVSPCKEQMHILDIGTGSGCIAIALKKKLVAAQVSALDISEEALGIAKANAELNQTKIDFLQADILNLSSSLLREKKSYEIIVSNPPYICISEKEQMSRNVVDYEPSLALFVNDTNPLLFYEAIAVFAIQHLAPDGNLYFEINQAWGKQVKKLLEVKGFKRVDVKKDMNGKDRIVTAALTG